MLVVVLQTQESYCPDVPYQYQKHKNKLKKGYSSAHSSFSADYTVSSILQVYGRYAEAAE